MNTHPNVPTMLDQLARSYAAIAAKGSAQPEDERRLYSILDDMRWYAQRLGVERWTVAPLPGRWSFADNLWHITQQAQEDSQQDNLQGSVIYYIDHGKAHIGQAAEIFALFEYS